MQIVEENTPIAATSNLRCLYYITCLMPEQRAHPVSPLNALVKRLTDNSAAMDEDGRIASWQERAKSRALARSSKGKLKKSSGCCVLLLLGGFTCAPPRSCPASFHSCSCLVCC